MSRRQPRNLANYDFPFHDYYHADENSTNTTYMVGANNLGQGKDQKKPFVSKSTLIMCTENTTIRFNNANNVGITILAEVWYKFYCNIYSFSHTAITTSEDLYVYMEGVLPEDTGVAEA